MSRTPTPAPQLEAVAVEGLSRGAFLLRGALATGAVLGGSAVGPFVRRALAQEGGDVDVLNFALTLEYLEATFYSRAIREGRGLGADTRRLVREIHDNEVAHVDALRGTIKQLGGRPVDAPKVGFGDVFTNRRRFVGLAQTLEDTGVSAYNGAAPQIRSSEVLAAAGSIVQVEARHAALIRLLNGETPAPSAFDAALAEKNVLDAVTPFLKS
ncbi:MAG TPA: ferritin-like domain-containing protein [Solirubrobacteraceae bacterium]|nr:ferritin-like domain-containing protein [Solirubrobacteraceae bacterium]